MADVYEKLRQFTHEIAKISTPPPPEVSAPQPAQDSEPKKPMNLTPTLITIEEKLENALNENAMLKEKLKVDKECVEYKFSSIKTLCDQLSEALDHLAHFGQVDKELMDGKPSESSVALDSLSQQVNELSLKLSSAEKTIKDRDKELEDLREKEQEYVTRIENLDAASTESFEALNSDLRLMKNDMTLMKDACRRLNTQLDLIEMRRGGRIFRAIGTICICVCIFICVMSFAS